MSQIVSSASNGYRSETERSNYPEGHSSSEGSHAKRKPGGNESSVVKKRAGRKRRGRSMGRYPFLTWAKKYLNSVGKGYAETTLTEMERRYRRMDREFQRLYDSGRVSTCNPEKITPEDVLEYVTHLKKLGMKESGILHNLGPLNNLLAYARNPSVTVFKQRYRSSVPKKRMMRYPALDRSFLQTILERSNRISEDEWRRMQAYALVTLALCSGLRNKEIRLCKVTDLNLRKMEIRAEHVKGEGTYGHARDVAIRPEAIGLLENYLRMRNKRVKEMCPDEFGSLSSFER